MSQTLNIPNFRENNIFLNTQTELTAIVVPGSSALPVLNNNSFTSLFVLVGRPGSDVAELLPNTTPTPGTSIPLGSNTLLQHSQGDPVYALFGSQIRIYRALDAGLGQQPPDSAFGYGTPYATVSIDSSSDSTQYTDAAGNGSYWYKFTYYNPTTSSETDIGSATAVRGAFTVTYCSLDDIRGQAGFTYAPYITNASIDQKRQAAQDEINGALDEFYQTPLQPPINDFIKDICMRLAAGLLRLKHYSQISNPQINGQNMYDAAQLDLDKLIMKERVLVNKQGQSTAGPGATGGVEGWPNSSTQSAPGNQGGAPRVFRMSDIQGQPMSSDSSGNPVGNLYYGRKY